MAFFLCTMIEKKYIPALLFAATIIITVAVYWPGLHSNFYLDDFPNLAPLEQVKEQGTLPYILGGESSPLGRPLSMATFAIQYQAWPDNPFAFKLVNLFIHLLNGSLVFIACGLLTSLVSSGIPRNRAIGISLITASLWLLHPVQTSTVLYTVQRMTELSAFFTLGGYALYLVIRKYIIESSSLSVYLLAGTAVWLVMVLAVLSKENGILLPLFIVLTEFTLLHSGRRSGKWKAWAAVFLGIPLVSLAVYLFTGLDDVLRGYQFREYSVSDRLLTQSGVLLVYLKNILLPQLSAFSIFTDDYPVARDGFMSAYILASLVVISAGLVFAILKRKSYPIISFSILWFLGGHSLESSHLNLEMFFDHRNYLPSFAVFFAMAWGLSRLYEKYRFLTLTGTALYFLLIISLTFANTSLWANTGLFLQSAAGNHPQSVRARTYLLNSYIRSGNIGLARHELAVITGLFPEAIYPLLKDVAITSCIEDKQMSARQWENLANQAGAARDIGFDNISALNNIAYLAANGYCDALDLQEMINVVIILTNNDNYRPWRSTLYDITATLVARQGDEDRFVQYIKSASRHGNSVPNKIARIELLLSMDRHADAEELLYALQKYLDRHKRLAVAWHDKLSALENRVKNNN